MMLFAYLRSQAESFENVLARKKKVFQLVETRESVISVALMWGTRISRGV